MNWIADPKRWGACVMTLVLAGGILVACDANRDEKTAASGKPTPAQQKAAVKMAAAAEKAYQAILEAEATRPHSAAMFDLKVAWSRNLGNALVAASQTPEERATALQGHLDRVTNMRAAPSSDLDWPGRNDSYLFAVAEAEYVIAADQAKGELTPGVLSAADRMLRATQGAYDGLMRLPDEQLRTPEYVELRLAWLRRAARAELAARSTAVQRLTVLEADIGRMNSIVAWVARQGTGATAAIRNQAAYAASETEFMIEANAGVGPKLNADQQTAAESMARNADAAMRALDALEDIYPRTPEFFYLRMVYSRRVAEAGMRLHPKGAERHRAEEEYLKRAKLTAELAASRTDTVGPNIYTTMAAYAVAEAEYWLASEP